MALFQFSDVDPPLARNLMRELIIDLLKCGPDGFDVLKTDFHSLTPAQLEQVAEFADAYGYELPEKVDDRLPHARERCFFTMLKWHEAAVVSCPSRQISRNSDIFAVRG